MKQNMIERAETHSIDDAPGSASPSFDYGRGLQIPLSSPAIIWRPRHVADSGVSERLPFLFWLTETLRPRAVVQLGLTDPAIYLSLCQACEHLDDGALCAGTQAQEPMVAEPLRALHDELYSDFSILTQSDADLDPLRQVGAVDLLVLNQEISVEAADCIRDRWLPLLSERAAVLICEPSRVFHDPLARETLFPSPNPSVVLSQTSQNHYGIEVMLYGEAPAERLKALAAQKPGTPAYLATRRVFGSIGRAIALGLENEALRKEQVKSLESLRTAQSELDARELDVQSKGLEVQAAKDAELREVARQAGNQARIFDLERALELQEQENSALAFANAALKAASEALEHSVSALKDAYAALEAKAAEAMSDLQTQLASVRADFDELAATSEIRLQAARADADKELDLALAEHKAAAAAAAEAAKAEIAVVAAERTALEAALGKAELAHESRVEDIALLARDFGRERTAYETRVKALEQQCATETNIIAALRTDASNLHSIKSGLESELSELRSALSAQAQELQHALEESRRFESDANRYREHYIKIRNTTSWRVTAPVRKAAKLIRVRERKLG